MLRILSAEPHKAKIIQKSPLTKQHKRQEYLRNAHYNTFNISSDKVTFDLTSIGTSAMSQEQLSGMLIGDEAYAGSRNFILLENVTRTILGHTRIVPTHNLLGAKKLIAKVLGKPSGEAVRAALCRAMKHLREILVRQGYFTQAMS